jgi:murein DD-endopeptidase MepM/ murein hydrolase activator NlpD
MPLRVFPVAATGAPHFVDDFGAVKPGAKAGAKKHQGVDIFADKGTPIFAPDDGAFEPREDPLGGHAFYLHAADGVYYGAHLDGYEGDRRSVAAGDVLGYVGQTGNAAATSPHLHFEWHPSGGVAVDPFRALSALTPQTPGDVHVEPAPPVDVDPLPPLAVVPGRVPPIPHREIPARVARPGVAAVGFALGAGLAIAVARRKR